MPRFYFDVRSGSTLASDEEGADFPSVAAAEAEARAAVLELAADKLVDGLDEVSVEVRSENGGAVSVAAASVSIKRL